VDRHRALHPGAWKAVLRSSLVSFPSASIIRPPHLGTNGFTSRRPMEFYGQLLAPTEPALSLTRPDLRLGETGQAELMGLRGSKSPDEMRKGRRLPNFAVSIGTNHENLCFLQSAAP